MDVASAVSTSITAGTALVQTIRGRYSLSGGDVPASYDEVNRASVEAVLALVARGYALVAGLQHTAQKLPYHVLTPGKRNTFTTVLADFEYLKDPSALDARLEGNRALQALDEECRQAHGRVFEEAYGVFEGITEYHKDLLMLIQQLGDGVFLHASLETLLMGHEGRQLTVECVSLLGVLMLMLERLVPGPIRERLIVAHLRYQGGPQAIGNSLNAVITLCASTGVHAETGGPAGPLGPKHPTGYPERYLARLPLPADVPGLLITCLKSDDLYSQIGHYPNPNHRSVALAQQAGYLYVLLFMRPDALQRDLPLMRMLVDKHFSDNWVVPWAPGLYADLAVEWENYKAARMALSAVITTPRARQLSAAVTEQLPRLQEQLTKLLAEGVLDAEYVLRNAGAVFGLLRTCNVALRWTLLQSATLNRKLRDAVVAAGPKEDTVVRFLVDTALAEFQVKKLYTQLLATRQRRWAHYKDLVQQQLRELSQFYSGSALLSRSLVDEPLAEWFAGCAARVGQLTGSPPTADALELRRLIAALDEVATYHKVESSLQAKESLNDIRAALETLCCLAAVREEMAASLAAMADFSYAWGIIHKLIPALQAHLRSHPDSVYGMRCVLIKCRSIMELPLLRLSHASSKHVGPVSQHYSRQLLKVIREVMQVVPLCVCELLEQIADLLREQLRPLPAHVHKDHLKALAALPERARMASLEEQVACYAKGVLATDRSMVGVIEWHPHTMLVEGLRQQLRSMLQAQMDKLTATCRRSSGSLLTFWVGTRDQPLAFTPADLARRSTQASGMQGLHDLATGCEAAVLQLRSMQAALVCVQDHLQVHGMLLWRQEFAALVRLQLNAELRRLRSHSLTDMDSSSPEVVLHLEHKGLPSTFLGHLTCELLRYSDPCSSRFQDEEFAWEEPQSGDILSLFLWRHLSGVLQVEGMVAVDLLLAWRMSQALQWTVHYVKRTTSPSEGTPTAQQSAMRGACRDLMDATGGPACCHYPKTGLDAYTEAAAASSKFCELLAQGVAAVGQAVLLRRALQVQLKMAAACQGPLSTVPLTAAVQGGLEQQAAQERHGKASVPCTIGTAPPARQPSDAQESLPPTPDAQARGAGSQQTTNFAAWVHAYGLQDPQIAPAAEVPLPTSPHLSVVLFLLLLHLAPRYTYCNSTARLVPAAKGGLDAAAVVAGLAALLRVAVLGTAEELCAYAGQCIRTLLQACSVISSAQKGVGSMEMPYRRQAATLLALLQQLLQQLQPQHVPVAGHVPMYLLSSWRRLFQHT